MAESTNGKPSPPKSSPGIVSKREAIRQALAKLGDDAGRQQIVQFAKEKFNLTLHPDHVSSTASDIRREAKLKAASAKPSAAVNPTPPPAPAPTPEKPPDQTPEPRPERTPEWVPERTREPIPHPSPIPNPLPTPAPAPGPLSSSNGKHSGGITLADIQTAKELLVRVGQAELKAMIDLLAG